MWALVVAASPQHVVVPSAWGADSIDDVVRVDGGAGWVWSETDGRSSVLTVSAGQLSGPGDGGAIQPETVWDSDPLDDGRALVLLDGSEAPARPGDPPSSLHLAMRDDTGTTVAELTFATMSDDGHAVTGDELVEVLRSLTICSDGDCTALPRDAADNAAGARVIFGE